VSVAQRVRFSTFRNTNKIGCFDVANLRCKLAESSCDTSCRFVEGLRRKSSSQLFYLGHESGTAGGLNKVIAFAVLLEVTANNKAVY
jgi:hypothetical protein